MGLVSSRLPSSAFVNTLQSALPSRSHRQVEPAPEMQSTVSANTLRSDKHRRFRTRFWKRNRNRTSCSGHIADDDYIAVFGRVERDTSQSLPSVSSVRRYRPDYLTPLSPSAECRLFVENIQVHEESSVPTDLERTTTTTQVKSETRFVHCRHCRNSVSACSSTASSPCATPLPHPTSHPVCRACYWHSLLPHDCGCFGPPVPFLSWDPENCRFEREHSTSLSPYHRPRTRFSIRTSNLDEPPIKKKENSPDQEDSVDKPDVSKQWPVEETENSEFVTCVCPMPSNSPCPCDKRLFEAMNPWHKFKTVLFVLLMIALTAWIVVFIIIG